MRRAKTQFIYMPLVLLLMVILSCNVEREDADFQSANQLTFQVGSRLGFDSNTKTTTNDRYVAWEAGDRVFVHTSISSNDGSQEFWRIVLEYTPTNPSENRWPIVLHLATESASSYTEPSADDLTRYAKWPMTALNGIFKGVYLGKMDDETLNLKFKNGILSLPAITSQNVEDVLVALTATVPTGTAGVRLEFKHLYSCFHIDGLVPDETYLIKHTMPTTVYESFNPFTSEFSDLKSRDQLLFTPNSSSIYLHVLPMPTNSHESVAVYRGDAADEANLIVKERVSFTLLLPLDGVPGFLYKLVPPQNGSTTPGQIL